MMGKGEEMKVLITGGTGFIGSQLALRCLERGNAVRVFGQLNTPAETENARMIEEKGADLILGSMTDIEKLDETVQGMNIVFHLAAAQHEVNVPDLVFWDINVKGTQAILDASIRAGVRRFVHGSTIGVYGSALSGMMDENSPLKPDNLYGKTKLAGEQAVIAAKDQLSVAVIRISETYGPGDRRLLKLFKGIKKRMFFIAGSGDNIHHLIYIQDLIDGFLLAADESKNAGEIFVLAGREPLTTTEMVHTIADVLGQPPPKLKLPLFPFLIMATVMEKAFKPFGIQPPLHRRRMDFFIKSFLFSQKKAAEQLDFTPKFSFHQGVSETADWYKQRQLL